MCHTGSSLSIGDLKAYPHNDTLPPTRPHLLIVPLPMGQAFKHMSLWGAIPIQTTTVSGPWGGWSQLIPSGISVPQRLFSESAKHWKHEFDLQA